MLPRAAFLTIVLATATLAGCFGGGEKPAPAATVAPSVPTDLVPLSIPAIANFTQSIVKPAVGVAQDLYEPTMEVSDTGTIYVAAHVIGAATTGTPAYFSNDHGKTWAPLPFASSVQTPPPLQGSQPPPGDEGFLVAGDKGQAWMADIYAAGFSVTGWCDNGKTQCYDDRQAYDRVASTTTCTPGSLNDRPWSAYANGSLLVVNNPGGGPLQIGIMDVPPALPIGVGTVNGPKWNMCASKGGSIPGIPAMRADGVFAVPQMDGAKETQVLNVIVGNKKDISKVETKEAFHVTSAGAGTINGGRSAFDHDGTLFVGARNNTVDSAGKVKGGQFILATSSDGGQTFKNATFATETPLQSLYLDGNMAGAGALLTWSQVGADPKKADWVVAHVFIGPDGAPVLKDVMLAVDEGPPYSAHVMGAAAGPDGRAYFVNFNNPPDGGQYSGSTPLSVWIQQDGPMLPVS